ncbi:S-adenosyl-L-methionine-dependent methyltransferase [Crassisporium funariophilum]|nr:S-adenosyl-L-methionine-dependent methyltransferase [Crassisporium funariophilum]
MASSQFFRTVRPSCSCRLRVFSQNINFYQGFSNCRAFSDSVPPSQKPTATSGAELSTEPGVIVKTRKPRRKLLPEEPVTVARARANGTPFKTSEEERRHKKFISLQLKSERHQDPEILQESRIELPHHDHWRPYFKDNGTATRMRASVRHPDTARLLAEAFVPEGSKDKIIIDVNPGPGQLTRALLNLPKERIKKIIVVEHFDKFLDFLRPLETIDSRVTVIEKNGKDWDTYTKIAEMGLLDEVQTLDWDQPVHPQLQFIMHLGGSVEGEQLISQLFRAMPNRQWLYKYGRIPMNFILTSRMYKRMQGPTGTAARCKVSVMAQAAAEWKEVVPFEALQPFSTHFHPENAHSSKLGNFTPLEARIGGNPMTAIQVIPCLEQYIKPGDLDYWDFCLRKLFVQKATPIEKCVGSLGPGAKNMLPRLTDPKLPAEERLDIKKNARSLDIREWALVVRAFKEWPFRPQVRIRFLK